MKKEPALKEQSSRLEEAYQKMNPEGRDALDLLVGQLAELHQMVQAGGRKTQVLRNDSEHYCQ